MPAFSALCFVIAAAVAALAIAVHIKRRRIERARCIEPWEKP